MWVNHHSRPLLIFVDITQNIIYLIDQRKLMEKKDLLAISHLHGHTLTTPITCWNFNSTFCFSSIHINIRHFLIFIEFMWYITREFFSLDCMEAFRDIIAKTFTAWKSPLNYQSLKYEDIEQKSIIHQGHLQYLYHTTFLGDCLCKYNLRFCSREENVSFVFFQFECICLS